MNKLSIIVPVYNVEKYISDFINSIHWQLNDDIELIIVDDGSLDNSLDILKYELSIKPKKNIQIVKQANGGLSAARNFGLSFAMGKYVGFIDPDDMVKEDYISTILEHLDDGEIDILTFNAEHINTNGEYVSKCEVCSPYKDFDKDIIDIFDKGRWYAWARIFKRDLIFSDFFPEGKRFEDLIAIPKLYFSAKNILNISNVLISYRCNPTGITNNINEIDIYHIKDFTDYLLKELSKNENENEKLNYKLLLSWYLSSVKTLCYLSSEFFGVLGSIVFLKRYFICNFILSFKDISFLSMKNRVFLKFFFVFYIHNKLRK